MTAPTSWLVAEMPLEGELEDSVARAVENVGPPASLVGLISLLLLVYAASGMMGATRSAFRAIWGSEARLPYVRGKLVDVALVLVAGLLILCAFGVTIITQIVETAGEELVRKLGGPASAARQLGAGLEFVTSVAVTFVAFLFLYRFVPTVRVRLRDALAGALVACAGFNLAAIGFSIYISRFADFDEVFGSLSAVFVFLVVVYVAVEVLLLGASVAAAWPGTAHAASRAGLTSAAPLRPSGERLGLDRVVLLLIDGAAFEQPLGLLDLCRRAGRAGDRPDVLVRLGLLRGHLLCVPPRHIVAVGDQVDEDAEERGEEHKEQPEGLLPAARITPAEDVSDDVEQQHEPHDPQEENEHRPEHVEKRVISSKHHSGGPPEFERVHRLAAKTAPAGSPVIIRIGRCCAMSSRFPDEQAWRSGQGDAVASGSAVDGLLGRRRVKGSERSASSATASIAFFNASSWASA